MDTTRWINGLLGSDKRSAIPIMTHPGIELLGRKVIDAVRDGQTHFEAVRILHEKFPRAAACTVIMDLTVEAEAFGAQIYFGDDEVPSVTGRLVSNYPEVEALEIPPLSAVRVSEYLKANRLAAANIDKPVFAGCIGPFSLAGRLFDMTGIMIGIYTEPETVELLLEKCTSFIRAYCRELKGTGVAGVIMAEPAAGLLANEDCLKYSSAYIKRIIDELQDDGFAFILHNCGNTGHCTAAMVSVGAKGYHFGNKIDMKAALDESPVDALVMGNLDPVGVIQASSPGEVARAASELLNATAGYRNFVLSSGCDTPPQVPFANIDAFYNALEEFNSR